MMSDLHSKEHESGYVLMLTLFLLVLLGGIVSSIFATSLVAHRSSVDTFDAEVAVLNAQSGVNFLVEKLSEDPTFFDSNAAPMSSFSVGDGTFQLLDAVPGTQPGQWRVTVAGTARGATARVAAEIGYLRLEFPTGLVLAGSLDPDDPVLELNGHSTVASYDPANGPFDINAPGENSAVIGNGSATLVGGSTVYGDMSLTGTTSTNGSASVTGDATAGAPLVGYDDLSPFAIDAIAASQATNDNSALAGIFGNAYQPVPGSQNYGDLVVNRGTYVVPAGTYRFRSIRIGSHANVIFDTSSGPSRVIVMGTGDSSSNPGLSVSGGSVQVASGGTSNPLQTFLAPDVDATFTAGATFGQPQGAYDSGHSQIFSAGADGVDDIISLSGGSTVYSRLFAPQYDLSISGNSSWYGSAVVRHLTLSGSTTGPSAFGVDEGALGRYLTDPNNFEAYAEWHGGYEQ